MAAGVVPSEFLLALVFLLGLSLVFSSAGAGDDGGAADVHIVFMRDSPAAHRRGESGEIGDVSAAMRVPGMPASYDSTIHSETIRRLHDSVLRSTLGEEPYVKLYSYHYLINGFAVFITAQQAEKLRRREEVAFVALDFAVSMATTHTPEFLGLPQGAWAEDGGPDAAGEGVVIGLVDTGIDPTHPSFSDLDPDGGAGGAGYPVPARFSGVCEVTPDFPAGSCNRKLVAARHFAASAITRGIFNASKDHASPFDGDGHGTHTASIAAGNHGIPVVVAGHHFGNASGMAPKAHIAVYKALYKSFGGFAADVVAAIDQAAQDCVDIISLSITPNRRPPGLATFVNPIDMALLSAVRAGIFVVQAAGNTGPAPKSVSSFSPWIFSIGASSHDRTYSNGVVLGNNVSIAGVGLAPGTGGDLMHTLITPLHALKVDAPGTATGPAVADAYLSECQDSSRLNGSLTRDKILICSYSIRFVLGLSSVKQALATAVNASSAGIIFYLDPFVIGFQLNPTPMHIPGLIIPSPDDSKVFMSYYNSSLLRDESTDQIIGFGGVARILGGLKPNFSSTAPQVMFYSARGPDPEDNSAANADILKPNMIAPGNSIWGAWSSLGLDSPEFQGERFAMISGTSMAAPHVAGLAALIKQKYPAFSPAAVASVLSTTASVVDRQGNPITAQRSFSNTGNSSRSPATPLDMGSGFVNATAALDPGLVFDAGYDDFISFLCGINGSAPSVQNFTGMACGASAIAGADLNLPSITLAVLNGSRTVTRTVTNTADDEEHYTVRWSAPALVSLDVSPTEFIVAGGQTQMLRFDLSTTGNGSAASFGCVGFYGSRGHRAVIPVTVILKVSYNAMITTPAGRRR